MRRRNARSGRMREYCITSCPLPAVAIRHLMGQYIANAVFDNRSAGMAEDDIWRMLTTLQAVSCSLWPNVMLQACSVKEGRSCAAEAGSKGQRTGF